MDSAGGAEVPKEPPKSATVLSVVVILLDKDGEQASNAERNFLISVPPF